ncbi:hypothetical protein LTR37_021394, partial [Vermiconidia calcicola]
MDDQVPASTNVVSSSRSPVHVTYNRADYSAEPCSITTTVAGNISPKEEDRVAPLYER